MVNPGVFSELYKPVSKILTTGYNPNKFDFSFKSKATNNVTFNSTGSRDFGDNQSKVTADFGLTHETKVKDVKLNVDATLNTAGKITVNATANNAFPNLKLKASGVMFTDPSDPNNRESATFSTEYKHDYFTLNNDVVYEIGGTTNNNSSFVVGYKGLAVGAESKLNVQSKQVKDYTFASSFTNNDLVIAAVVRKKATEAALGYSQKLTKDVQLAAEFVQPLEQGKRPSITVGTEYKLDPECTIRAKVNTSGVVAANYSRDITKNTNFTVATELDSVNLHNAKLGFGLKFNFE